MTNDAAIIVAAGRGERFGGPRPKALVELAGVPIVRRTVDRFVGSAAFGDVVVAAPAGELDAARDVLRGTPARVVAGGRRRQDSVLAALRALPGSVAIVAVHDAARPLVSARVILETVEAARSHGAAIAALPVSDTVKEVSDEGFVLATRSRQTLWLAQTPQAFRRELLLEAHERAAADGAEATDDAALVARLGHAVRVVPGEASNLKITVPADLELAAAWLAATDRRGG